MVSTRFVPAVRRSVALVACLGTLLILAASREIHGQTRTPTPVISPPTGSYTSSRTSPSPTPIAARTSTTPPTVQHQPRVRRSTPDLFR